MSGMRFMDTQGIDRKVDKITIEEMNHGTREKEWESQPMLQLDAAHSGFDH